MCCAAPAPNMRQRIPDCEMQEVHGENDSHGSCTMGACMAMDHDILASIAQGVLNALEERFKHSQTVPAPQCITELPAINGEADVVWGARLVRPNWARHVRCAIDEEADVLLAKAFQVVCG